MPPGISFDIDIDGTFGACLIGAQIGAFFYGLTTLQSYNYFVSYPEDSVENKALVSVVWFLDSIHIIFVSMSLYHYLVTNYGNPTVLAVADWLFFASFGINILIICLVQTFFTIRIFRLASSKVRWWLTSVIGISIMTHCSLGFKTLVLTIIEKEFAKFELPKISLYSATPCVVFVLVSDVLIAGSLCVLLHKNRTGYRKMNAIITTLIIYAINRCLLTSVVVIVDAITFFVIPGSLWYMAIDFIVGKLYANSLLATLNSRQTIRATEVSEININNTHLANIRYVGPTDLTSNSQPTDNGAFVLDIHAGSISRSSGMQSCLSAKDKVSAATMDPAHRTYDYHESRDSTRH